MAVGINQVLPQSLPPGTEALRRNVERLNMRIVDLDALEPETIGTGFKSEVTALEIAIDETLSEVFGHRTTAYNRYLLAAKLYDRFPASEYRTTRDGHGRTVPYEETRTARAEVVKRKQRSLTLLRQAIRKLQEEIAEREQHEPSQDSQMTPAPDLSKVFVVHGHDVEVRQTVARFIEKLGFEAVILHERPNKGRTIITKFREEAAGVGFAVVLMTPDDIGGVPGVALTSLGAQLRPRARQNVVFELGFFIGELGPDRVAALVKGDIERPSDFDGVVYISLDSDKWKAELARELEEAGYTIDWKTFSRT